MKRAEWQINKTEEVSIHLTEGQKEGQADENSFEEFMRAANWWSGESFAALTD